MIKAEIQKNNVTYVIDVTRTGSLDKAYDVVRDVATGREVYHSETQILDLGTNKNFDHIRVYIEADQVVVAEPEALPAVKPFEDYLRAFTDKLSFLGNTIEVAAVKARTQGVEFVLVYEVNTHPALLALSRISLDKLAHHVGLTQGMEDPTVVMQPADLVDEEDAVEYMKDYIAELAKAADNLPKEDHTAVAYPDFNKDE